MGRTGRGKQSVLMAIISLDDYKRLKAKKVQCFLHRWQFTGQNFDGLYRYYECKKCGATKRTYRYGSTLIEAKEGGIP
jgi:hypothetical protein